MTEEPNIQQDSSDEKPLEGWKEIASHLQRGVRTVKRWEKDEALPVRRHQHQARASVYAYPSELDAWREQRKPGAGPLTGILGLWPVRALAATATLVLALLTAASGPILTPANALDGDGGIVVRQVWAGPEVTPLGALPADGRYLSFVDWATGDLALRDLVTGENRRLTHKGSWQESSEFALYSVPSPDGRQIAYQWFNGFNEDIVFDLRLIGADGSDPRILFSSKENEYMLPTAWSPAGDFLIALSTLPDRTHRIVRIALSDGSVRVLKSMDWRYVEKMSLSPDGRHLVYDFPAGENSSQRDIFLLATDGSRETVLVRHDANDSYPLWTPGGERVLFVSDRTGAPDLWAVPVEGGKPNGPPALVKQDIGRFFPIGMTDSGAFYYSLTTSLRDVYTAKLDLNTGTLLSPPTPVSGRFARSYTSPDWSPDGRVLSSVSQRGHLYQSFGTQVLSLRSLQTKEERELPIDIGNIRHCRWSPDGTAFVCIGQDRKNRGGIYVLDAQTGKASPVVRSEQGGAVQWPSWTPDSRAVLYRLVDRAKKTKSIVKHDLETGRSRVLHEGKPGEDGNSSDYAISPDGQWLAFLSLGTSQPNRLNQPNTLRLKSLADGTVRELVRVSASESIPGWARLEWTQDSKNLLFVRARARDPEQKREIWIVSVEGGEPRRLNLPPMPMVRYLSLHPDGQTLAFAAGVSRTEIWVMEDFLPKPKVAQAEQ